LQTAVKKWFRDKECGFLDNGNGPDIMVRKADLINCDFLKVGVIVEFECHLEKQKLIAKKVKLSNRKHSQQGVRDNKPYRPGVMT
jgi:cold shock CspA family protein